MKPFRRILFATDFSPASAAAGRQAFGLAKASHGRLWIAHAVAPLARAQAARWAYLEMEREIRAGARKHLDRLRARAGRGGVKATALLLSGAPHEAVARAARAQKVDLVVIGTHGRTGLKGALLGSVASRIIATATCPVLTVRSRGSRR